jgi:DNA primase
MGRVPEETIEKILQYSNIVEVISEFVPLKKSGRNYMGVCPFHSDKGPSLSVSMEKQLYHCFGCGASGNVIGFIMRLRNLEYLDAIKLLADKANITIEEEENNPQKAKEKKFKDSLYEINIQAARYFYSNLKKSSEAFSYFKNRSLEDKTIQKFGLGYSLNSWDDLYNYLIGKGYDKSLIIKAGLVISDTEKNRLYDRFRNRIIFPVFDFKGRVIGFGGRVLDEAKPKYLNSPETPVFTKGTNLYGLNFIIKSGLPDNIIIVEGYMDCISLHQQGITNVCASLGTALTLEQAKLLRRFSRNVFICYDADAAGKAATLRGLEILTSVDCNVKIISIPRGKDPDEFIKANGKAEFEKLIENAVPIAEYRILRAKDGKNLKDPREKGKFINEISEILSGLSNEVEAQTYASKIYDETGVDVKLILNNVQKIRDTVAKNTDTTISAIYDINIEQAYKKAEILILKSMLLNEEYFTYIKNNISSNEFITSIYKEAADYILETKEKNENVDSNKLMMKYKNENDISDISKIFIEEEVNIDISLINDLIRTIRKSNLENKIAEITVEIKKCEEKKEFENSADLFKSLITLQKQLGQL